MKKFIILSQLFLISTLLNYNFCYPLKEAPIAVAKHLLGKSGKDLESQVAHITLQPTPEEQKKQAYDHIPLQISIRYLIDTLIDQAKTFKDELDKMGLKAEDFADKNEDLILNFGAVDLMLQRLNRKPSAMRRTDIPTRLLDSKNDFFVGKLFGGILKKYTTNVGDCIKGYQDNKTIINRDTARQSVLNLASVSIGLYKIALKCVNLDAYTEETTTGTGAPKKTKISSSVIGNLILNKFHKEGTNIEDIPLQFIIKLLIDILTDQTQKFTLELQAARANIKSKFDTMLENLEKQLKTADVETSETREKIELIKGIIDKFKIISEKIDILTAAGEDKQLEEGELTQTYYPNSINYKKNLEEIKDNFCEKGIFNDILSYYTDNVCGFEEILSNPKKDEKTKNAYKIKILTPLLDLLRCLFTIAEIAKQSIGMQAQEVGYRAHNIGLSIIEFDYYLTFVSRIHTKEKLSTQMQNLLPLRSQIKNKWKIFNVKNSILRILRQDIENMFTRDEPPYELDTNAKPEVGQTPKTAAMALNNEILKLIIAAQEKRVAPQPEPPHPTPEPKTVSEPQPPAHPSPAVQPKQPIKKPAKKPVSHR
jgi:hypothetical protein